jgi:hypothetical protein
MGKRKQNKKVGLRKRGNGLGVQAFRLTSREDTALARGDV